MGDVVRFQRHVRVSAVSGGYKSGRNSCLGIPEIRSTAKTRNGGTSSHCDTAWGLMPRGSAKPANPPAALIARSRAVLRSVMAENSSIALEASQVLLHCASQGALYDAEMTLGNRIKQARERLRPKITQKDLGDKFGISDKAVSSWERGETIPDFDKMPKLRQVLRVTYVWLMEGNGPPPAENDPRVLMDDLAPAEWAALNKTPRLPNTKSA